MSNKEGFFEFKGKVPILVFVSLITTLAGGGYKIFSLSQKVDDLSATVCELKTNSESVKDRLPRIETNLDNIKAILQEIKDDQRRTK